MGGLIGVYLRDGHLVRPGPIAQAASLAGLAMIAVAVLLFDESMPFPGWHALLPVLGTALVILFAVEGTWAQRWLSLRPMVAIGLISYSAYLWHQPLFAFARHAAQIEPAPWTMPLLIGATLLLAALSWRYVEAPFRNRQRVGRKAIFLGSLAGLIGFAAVGAAIFAFAVPLSERFGERLPRLFDYTIDNRALQIESWEPLRKRTGVRGYKVENNRVERQLWFDMADPRTKLLLVGNSHAKDMYNALISSDTISREFQTARFGIQFRDIAGSGFYQSPNYRAANVVLLTTSYDPADARALEGIVRRIVADGKIAVVTRMIPASDEFASGRLSFADAEIIRAIDAGETDAPAIVRRLDRGQFRLLTSREDRKRRLSDDAIDRVRAKHPGLIVLDRFDLACDRARAVCFSADDRLNKFYFDGSHTTLAGARFFGRRIDATGWFAPVLRAVRDETTRSR